MVRVVNALNIIIIISMKVQRHEFVSAHKGLEYVENFEALCQDLEDLNDPISDATKRAYFEKGIRNREYRTAIEPIILDKSKSYHDIAEAVELYHARHMTLRQTAKNNIRTTNNQQQENSWRGGGGRYHNSGRGGRCGRGSGRSRGRRNREYNRPQQSGMYLP